MNQDKYYIRPLEWDRIIAETPFGTYVARDDGWEYCFDEYYDEGGGDADSFEDAKKKAEDHWQSRIKLVLTLVKESK